MISNLKKIISCSAVVIVLLSLISCYKQEDLTMDYADGRSTVVYNLPGDTLASDGWESQYEVGDTYLRQRYFNSSWTDSIRFVPIGDEVINAAAGVNSSVESTIKWLPNNVTHPNAPHENEAYRNVHDQFNYIYRSNAWFRMDIKDDSEIDRSKLTINWRGFVSSTPANPQQGWVYGDSDNGRIYLYQEKAWVLMLNNGNYNNNIDFIQVEYSKSGKETGKYSLFTFRFSDGKQQFVRDAADSIRYLPKADWDLAFTGDMNSHVWLNNAKYNLNPAFGGTLTKSALIMYEYGYDFMNEAPEDEFFDSRPVEQAQISYSSQYGPGINPWYEYGSTFIAKPFPYRAYYLRLEQLDGTYLYGKLQLISMYKGAPEALTDRNWPSPYLTFRYFIQKDGSRNLRTKD